MIWYHWHPQAKEGDTMMGSKQRWTKICDLRSFKRQDRSEPLACSIKHPRNNIFLWSLLRTCMLVLVEVAVIKSEFIYNNQYWSACTGRISNILSMLSKVINTCNIVMVCMRILDLDCASIILLSLLAGGTQVDWTPWRRIAEIAWPDELCWAKIKSFQIH